MANCLVATGGAARPRSPTLATVLAWPAGSNLTQRLVLRVANTGGGVVVTDLNARLPRTTTGYMFQQDSSNMAFAQLAPMIKVPLSTIDTSIRWMQLIYGAVKLYTPRHNVLFRNIGRSVDFVGTP